jgi:uncharacterized protein (TIRG00374 family)
MLTPQLLRRGLQVFAVISMVGFAALLFYGNNFSRFAAAMVSLQWGWLLVGVALASLDWFGGGLRLYVLARHVYDDTPLGGSIVAGGLNTWAGYLTPAQSGGGPMMVYALMRCGVPAPEATISSLMTFVATVIFFAIAGPLTILLGAGHSLEQHGVLGVVSLLDLYHLTLGTFIGIGGALILVFAFPKVGQALVRRTATLLQRRYPAQAARVRRLEEGVERSHECLVAFFRGRGWLALAAGVVLSAAAHANKLLAGYVVLRMLGLHGQFVDVILLQTLITFLLYFAPTPGGSGLAELVSAAVMSIYVPRELTPSYILLWRILTSYLTVAFGSFVFLRLVKATAARPTPGAAAPA